MAVDKDGVALAVGDTVMLSCVVKEIYAAEQYTNIVVETTIACAPSDRKLVFAVNSKQTDKP